MILCSRERKVGDPCMGEWILANVLTDIPELTWQETIYPAASRMLLSAIEQDRTELVVFDGTRVVGFACLVEEYDMHVGRCLTVMWDYVVPSHRGGTVGQRMLRAAVKLARQLDHQVLCYTHRTGLGEYLVKYKRLEKHNGQEGKEHRQEGD